MMRKVEFVHVKSILSGFGLGRGNYYEFENIEEIVQQRIEEGWTYQGYLPYRSRGTGETSEISLVFVKEE